MSNFGARIFPKCVRLLASRNLKIRCGNGAVKQTQFQLVFLRFRHRPPNHFAHLLNVLRKKGSTNDFYGEWLVIFNHF